MKAPYEFIDHTGDIAARARGKNLPELFQNALSALFAAMTDPALLNQKESFPFALQARDTEALLVEFLSEALFLFDHKRFLIREAAFTDFSPQMIKGSFHGEFYNARKHAIKTELKAVTFHGLKIEKKENELEATVVFDV